MRCRLRCCADDVAGMVMGECVREHLPAANGSAEHTSLQAAAREVCAVKQVPSLSPRPASRSMQEPQQQLSISCMQKDKYEAQAA